MVELTTKISDSGVLYIPKEIREAFSRNMKIIPNAKAAVFFPADALYEDVLASLEIITMDVKHRIRIRTREASKTLEDGDDK